MIRKAIGMWTRNAIADWHRDNKSDEHILVGEAPFVGERFMQVAKVYEDTAEALLASERTQFILPVPTKRVRQVIEAKREKTISNPQHPHEKEDAPPNILRMLWYEIHRIAEDMDFAENAGSQPDYDPDVYRKVYEYLLQHRNSITLSVDEVFEAAGSVYELEDIVSHLQATEDEVEQIMAQLERESTVEAIQAEVDGWYKF